MKTLNDSGFILDRDNKYRGLLGNNCHEGLSATNPNYMTCMLNKYFELVYNNNSNESLAVPNIVEYKKHLQNY